MNAEVEAFAARYTRVWHVMEAEGTDFEVLYPAATLLGFSGLPADSANRDDFQLLSLPGGRSAVLRKQLMPDERLRPTLSGTFAGRPELWRDHINRHVFFWVSTGRRDRFLNACVKSRARGAIRTCSAPIIIELDTASLLAVHHGAAFFSRINTGSTIRGGAKTRRDETTLRPVRAWRGEQAVELAIRGPVAVKDACLGWSRVA